MSIYSGFATRFQEQAYDNCIDSLLYILQKRIIKFYQGDTADEEKFITLVLKLHQQMRTMEKSKYLEPKSSHSVSELIKYMHNFQLNLTPPNGNSNVKSKASEPAEAIEPKPSLPDLVIEKKKSMFWVQKKAAEIESNKTQTEQEVQTMGTINKNVNGASSTEEKFEFRRTAYQPRNIRALNVKNASRSKLSGEKREERYIGLDEKQIKKRAMSNHIQSKHIIHSKEANHQLEGQSNRHHLQRRKNRSVSRVNHPELATGNEGQVADIIKDYIIKAKKNYLRGHRIRETKETIGKVHDF